MRLEPGSRPVPNYPDYILIRKLGAGAFGEVWHAHGPGGIDVALKFIPLDTRLRTVELRSLELMRRIRHPNLVSLFGAWHKENCLILAMELCERTLQDRLVEALHQQQHGIPLDELLTYMSDAANGLDALHAKHVAHRDIKPANLLLLNSGVKVADYGLAKALEQTVASNSGAGTLAYTAPECFKGELTQQSDQYSLAVTYYHLRTGRLLFKGDQAQVMYAHLELEPDLSHLAPAEGAVLARALSKEPDNRWANCNALVNELIRAYQHAKEELRNDNALFYYNRGKDWLDKKDYDKAIADFTEAICLDPKDAVAYHDRGTAWFVKGDHDRALADFSQAIRLDPNYVSAYHWRAPFWNYHKKDYDKAIADYSELIRLDPEGALDHHSRRGALFLFKNEYDDAIKDFNEVIRRDPKDAFAYHFRGLSWDHKKEYDKAISDYSEAIRLDPKCASAYRSFAQLLATCPEERVRNGQRAVRMATKACELTDVVTSSDLTILAAAYAEAGKFDEAVRHQAKVLEHPDYRGRNGDHFRQRLELYKQKKAFRQGN